jgi:hypothetical protein
MDGKRRLLLLEIGKVSAFVRAELVAYYLQ